MFRYASRQRHRQFHLVQRVPVRIEVPVTVAEQELLRPGMSVVVSVNSKAQPNKAAASAAPATDTVARRGLRQAKAKLV